QGIQGGGQRSHRGGKDTCQHKAAYADRHHVQNIGAEQIRIRNRLVGGVLLVVDIEQNADEGKRGGDGKVHESSSQEAPARFLVGFCCEHPLHHVLIGSKGRHIEQRGADQCRKEGVVADEDEFDILPQIHRMDMLCSFPRSDLVCL